MSKAFEFPTCVLGSLTSCPSGPNNSMGMVHPQHYTYQGF